MAFWTLQVQRNCCDTYSGTTAFPVKHKAPCAIFGDCKPKAARREKSKAKP